MQVEELPDDYLKNTTYFYISQINETTLEAIKRAKSAGASIVMDADNYSPGDEEAFGLIDVMIGSEFYYKALFGNEDYEANCRSLREKGPNIVVFTQGSKGCLGVGEEGFSHSPPIRWRWSIRWGPVMFFTERSLRGSCRDIQQRKPPVLPAPYRQSNVRESEEGQGYRIGKLCVSSWKQAGLIIGKLKNGYSIINGDYVKKGRWGCIHKN